MASATITAPARQAARRAGFGLATATFVLVSNMIGTGVLTTSGFTVYFIGSNQLSGLLVLPGRDRPLDRRRLLRAAGRLGNFTPAHRRRRARFIPVV